MNDNSKGMHARATQLAKKAMNDNIAAIESNAASFIDDGGDYGRAQADYDRRVIENRNDGLARSRAHNDALRVAAAIRKHGGCQLDMFPA